MAHSNPSTQVVVQNKDFNAVCQMDLTRNLGLPVARASLEWCQISFTAVYLGSN